MSKKVDKSKKREVIFSTLKGVLDVWKKLPANLRQGKKYDKYLPKEQRGLRKYTPF